MQLRVSNTLSDGTIYGRNLKHFLCVCSAGLDGVAGSDWIEKHAIRRLVPTDLSLFQQTAKHRWVKFY